MAKASCPECYAWIRFPEQVSLGMRLTCIQCGVEVEVVRLDPLELDYAVYPDWEDIDWEDLIRDENFSDPKGFENL